MAYTTADPRRQRLDELADATDEISSALASLGEAYELVDEQTADRLQLGLFLPVQVAYWLVPRTHDVFAAVQWPFARAQRTHKEFADRHDLPHRVFVPATPGAPSHASAASRAHT